MPSSQLHVSDKLVHIELVPGSTRVNYKVSVLGEEELDLSIGIAFVAGANVGPGRPRPRGLKEVPVHVSDRRKHLEGTWDTPEAGSLAFILDNSFSWVKEKDVLVEVEFGAAHPEQSAVKPEPAARSELSAVQPEPAAPDSALYTFYYWPGFSGRLEPMLLLLADAGVPCSVNRDVKSFLYKGGNLGFPAFACPVLVESDGFTLCQTTAILQYLGTQHGYRPRGQEQFIAAQMACTAADIWSESYAARKRDDNGDEFMNKRYPTWVNHLESCLEATPGPYFGGESPTYADFALLNAIRVVQFMFGRQNLSTTARLEKFQASMEGRPRVAEYLAKCEPVLYPEVGMA